MYTGNTVQEPANEAIPHSLAHVHVSIPYHVHYNTNDIFPHLTHMYPNSLIHLHTDPLTLTKNMGHQSHQTCPSTHFNHPSSQHKVRACRLQIAAKNQGLEWTHSIVRYTSYNVIRQCSCTVAHSSVSLSHSLAPRQQLQHQHSPNSAL